MAKTYLEKARQLIRIEAKSIAALEERIDDNFRRAVEIIFNNRGKVIVVGIGKSGLVGRKISATLSSTGTPSFFIHAGEAGHGDLGGISREDILLLISNSGETEELIHLIPGIKKLNIPIIGFIGQMDSTLTRRCDITINTHVQEEACPLGLVPTSSSIVTSAMGDALAIALLQKRGFKKDDFAGLHPAGILGRRLLTTVADLMHTGDEVPICNEDNTMKDALFVMTAKKLGVVGILKDGSELSGVITDGDLRRGLERTNDFLNRKAKDIMTSNPKWILKHQLAIDALHIMEEHEITSLFVYNDQELGMPAGIIHIHDILKFGILS